MQQDKLIDAVRQRFDGDKRVGGLYLSGSFGNGTADQWSDVDFVLVTAGDVREEVISDFLETAEGVGPLISSNRMDVGVSLVHNVLEDWTRFDMLVGDDRALGGKTQADLKVLLDPDQRWEDLPEAFEWKGPDAQRIHAIVKEYTRVLGLTSVGHGREDWATLVLGCGILRMELVKLMTLAVPMVDTGGILHNRKIFSPEHYEALLALPAVEATWEAACAFNRSCSEVFYPLARKMTDEAGGEWPERFIEATRAHLVGAVGVDLVGSW